MDYLSGHVMNLANSIIGVSILAMPYCFKQCGILLSIFMLLISSIISRLASHFLLKSAIMARRKTFEFLAFHIFGTLGKFSIEIGMIGFLLGTCIAFFVVMGDLGPEIVSQMTGAHVGNALRNSILIALAVFCVLPLGLLKNVDSLNGVSKATIGFYCCLVLKIVIEALPHIFTGDWVSEVILWRPAGILQCLPIFSMALFCQTQIFEIYQALPNASLDKMNGLIRVAVNICTWVYIFVGTFGYIAFFRKPFTGNILLSFRPSIMSDVMKMGFVLSLAFSFPLVIFPCRASLYSLLYKGPSYTTLHEGSSTNYIPEGKFKMLTLIIVTVSLIIGLLIPNIELVLGLVGSTIGVMICVLFPVTCFICISPKNTNERILAQTMLFVGVIVMVLGTYANLYAFEESKLNIPTEKHIEKIDSIPKDSLDDVARAIMLKQNMVEQDKPNVLDIPTTVKLVLEDNQKPNNKIEQPDKVNVSEEKVKKQEDTKEVRHEPPQPEEPVENQLPSKPPDVIAEKPKEVLKEIEDKNDKQGPVVEPIQPNEESKPKENEAIERKIVVDNKKENIDDTAKVENEDKKVEKATIRNDEVDIEAIKKEEKELKEQEKEKQVDRNQILIDTIQKQNEVQKEIVEQQKKLIAVIEKQQQNVNNNEINKVNEEKLKAVQQIERIARKAIESISGKENKKLEKNEEKTVINQTKVEEIKDNKPNNSEDIKKIANETNKINMVPLPLALAKLNNATIENKNDPAKNNVLSNPNISKGSQENVKTIRRDILSANRENKNRTKREIKDEVKLNKPIKEVCDELNKSTSTEKPIIKMLCKLSEPDLVQVDMEMMEEPKPLDLKPQTRDLKHVPGA